jgi:hypothetical protein
LATHERRKPERTGRLLPQHAAVVQQPRPQDLPLALLDRQTVKLELKDLDFQVFDDQFATVVGGWKLSQVDPDGRNHDQTGRCMFALCRLSDDWKIVAQHFSHHSEEGAAT